MPDEKTDEATDETGAKKPTRTSPPREQQRCSKEGCKRPYRAKGYCNVHYAAWRHGAIEGHRARYKRCTKEGCNKPRAAGSLCAEHVKGGQAAAG